MEQQISLYRKFRNYISPKQRKRNALLAKFKKVGERFIFDLNSHILSPEHMEVGDNVFIGEGAHFSAVMKIGNNVMFGPRVLILGGDHFVACKGRSVRFLRPKGGENMQEVIIEDEAWIGAGVIILKGVNIGMGGIIGAGSVLRKSIPPYVVAVGSPCVPVRKVFSDENLYEHLTLLKYPAETAASIVERRRAALEKLGLLNLPVIDQTDIYWENLETPKA
ncbi:MAG TPA: DapH/DapD/GlmU-related protein [Ignavibacteriales bacterium]|nr:DapH/DapD/GlmU-related protein [Ignavibacteriales bacterium]